MDAVEILDNEYDYNKLLKDGIVFKNRGLVFKNKSELNLFNANCDKIFNEIMTVLDGLVTNRNISNNIFNKNYSNLSDNDRKSLNIKAFETGKFLKEIENVNIFMFYLKQIINNLILADKTDTLL